METRTYLYEVVDNDGNGLTGFKTKEQAELVMNRDMRKDKEWHIRSYKAQEWELN